MPEPNPSDINHWLDSLFGPPSGPKQAPVEPPQTTAGQNTQPASPTDATKNPVAPPAAAPQGPQTDWLSRPPVPPASPLRPIAAFGAVAALVIIIALVIPVRHRDAIAGGGVAASAPLVPVEQNDWSGMGPQGPPPGPTVSPAGVPGQGITQHVRPGAPIHQNAWPPALKRRFSEWANNRADRAALERFLNESERYGDTEIVQLARKALQRYPIKRRANP